MSPAWAGGIGVTYTGHLKLNGKLIMDFLFMLIGLFSLGVTAEALRANIDWKSAQLKGWVSFGEIFTYCINGRPARIIFAWIYRIER